MTLEYGLSPWRRVSGAMGLTHIYMGISQREKRLINAAYAAWFLIACLVDNVSSISVVYPSPGVLTAGNWPLCRTGKLEGTCTPWHQIPCSYVRRPLRNRKSLKDLDINMRRRFQSPGEQFQELTPSMVQARVW